MQLNKNKNVYNPLKMNLFMMTD